jgi:hypothetical protein
MNSPAMNEDGSGDWRSEIVLVLDNSSNPADEEDHNEEENEITYDGLETAAP